MEYVASEQNKLQREQEWVESIGHVWNVYVTGISSSK